MKKPLKYIGIAAGPLLFGLLLLIPAPEVFSPEGWRVIAVAVMMLVWWITEAVPIPVTALLPIILFPMLNVMKIEDAAAPYGSPIVFLFLGGFAIALAMQKWNLHRRIALTIIRMTGTGANQVILGVMAATFLLSMWISNTATTVMMLPIATSLVDLLSQNRPAGQEKGLKNFALATMLGIAFAANVGGTATIIGTPPNLVLVGFLEEHYGYELTFLSWMRVGLPFALVMFGIIYFGLVYILFPNKLGKFDGSRELINEEVRKLGPIQTSEWVVLAVFVFAALLWIVRSPLNHLLPFLHLSDAAIALIATVGLFVLPVNARKMKFVLDWEDTKNLPWGILLLFGGGLSLAKALAQTGLLDLIGAYFAGLEVGAGVLIGLIVALTLIGLFLTEVMSNVALVTVFIPVVAGIALGLDVHPLYLAIPVTLAASCAFMLPMATPPNAIVFASGHIKVSQMATSGIGLNIIAVLFISFLGYWILPLLFDLTQQLVPVPVP